MEPELGKALFEALKSSYPILAGAGAGLAAAYLKETLTSRVRGRPARKRVNVILSAHLDRYALQCEELSRSLIEGAEIPLLDPDPPGIDFNQIDDEEMADYLHLKTLATLQKQRVDRLLPVLEGAAKKSELLADLEASLVMCSKEANRVAKALRQRTRIDRPDFMLPAVNYREIDLDGVATRAPKANDDD
ncbi:MAG: hypothetical protein AAF503_09195 [Pseudomonadota bacterium]